MWEQRNERASDDPAPLSTQHPDFAYIYNQTTLRIVKNIQIQPSGLTLPPNTAGSFCGKRGINYSLAVQNKGTSNEAGPFIY